jgi:hypothetical protein
MIRTRGTALAGIAAVALLVAVLSDLERASASQAVRSMESTPAVAPTPPTRAAATRPTVTEAAFSAALKNLTSSGHLAVAVEDLSTGRIWTAGTGSYDTASIVKVDILAALLLRAQDQNRVLTGAETTLATAMIERSDDESATDLFEEIGGEDGLSAANARMGITGVEVGADGYWGLTRTTAVGQLSVLRAVFGAHSLLSRSSIALETSLMRNVIPAQDFGVSAAGGSDTALKVGYLQRTATGLWDVTSIGRTTVRGHTYLVALLSDDSATFDAGEDLIDAAASAAMKVLGVNTG